MINLMSLKKLHFDPMKKVTGDVKPLRNEKRIPCFHLCVRKRKGIDQIKY